MGACNCECKCKIETLDKTLPTTLICLSCLATQSTLRVINNDNTCVVCDNPIDPYNLSKTEV